MAIQTKTAQNNNATVAVPVATLNCIRSLLFNSEDGVNLSGIVKDIAGVQENEDLTAINVALAFKGIKPEIDSRPRFEQNYKSVYKWELIHVSLITGIVKYKVTSAINWKDGQWKDGEIYQQEHICPIDGWLNMPTDEISVKKRVEENYPFKPQE